MKCLNPRRRAHTWCYLARNRGAPRFVMTSLSCRRVDDAPRHCRFLRTFDFAGDCRVNFSGVCRIVAREYGGRCSAATREGCLGYSSFSSSTSRRFFFSPFARPPLCNVRALRLPSLRRFQITGFRNGAPVVDGAPPRRAIAETRASGLPRFFFFCVFFCFASRLLS